MSRELPDRLTPCAVADVGLALYVAWRELFGEEPGRGSLLVLLAQWALETGRGKACHCYNLGNAKSVDGDGYDYTFFRCNEVIGGRVVWFDPPHPACRFRAFETLEAGAADYLALLHRRFASAWPAVLAGDPADFAHRLKAARYYTANEAAYAAGLTSLFCEFDRTVPRDVPGVPDVTSAPTGDPEAGSRLLGVARDLDSGIANGDALDRLE